MHPENLAQRIDHTNLKPNATKEDIKNTIREGLKYSFRGVCIPPTYVDLGRKILKDSEVKLVTVIGFPLGYTPTDVKVMEAVTAEQLGADEIDVVMNISAFKSREYTLVREDLKRIIESVGIPVKVIIETSYLEPNEIQKACEIVKSVGAFCVKTNTGFGKRGVTIDDVRIIRRAVGPNFPIKASGGIRTAAQALEIIRAGADIIGTSSGVAIIEEYKKMTK